MPCMLIAMATKTRTRRTPGGASAVRPAEVPPQVEKEPSKILSAKVAESDKQFWLALSHGQVLNLVQQEAAARGGGHGLLRVVLALNGVDERIGIEELARDERYQGGRVSKSVILGLVVLGAFALGEHMEYMVWLMS